MTQSFQLGIVTDPKLTIADIETLRTDLLDSGISILVEEREGPSAYACLEWVVATTVTVFLVKSYFDGAIKEIGKRHLDVLWRALSKFGLPLVGENAPEVVLISTKGKLDPGSPYGHIFSIFAELPDRHRFKLLFRKKLTKPECDEIHREFITFMDGYYRNLKLREAVNAVSFAEAIAGTIVLEYDFDSHRFSVLSQRAKIAGQEHRIALPRITEPGPLEP